MLELALSGASRLHRCTDAHDHRRPVGVNAIYPLNLFQLTASSYHAIASVLASSRFGPQLLQFKICNMQQQGRQRQYTALREQLHSTPTSQSNEQRSTAFRSFFAVAGTLLTLSVALCACNAHLSCARNKCERARHLHSARFL